MAVCLATDGAVDPWRVLGMRADWAIELCAARGRLARRARRADDEGRRDGESRVMPDGTRVTAIRSMDSLRSFLGSRGR